MGDLIFLYRTQSSAKRRTAAKINKISRRSHQLKLEKNSVKIYSGILLRILNIIKDEVFTFVCPLEHTILTGSKTVSACVVVTTCTIGFMLQKTYKKLGMDTADPQNRSEWRGRLRRRLVCYMPNIISIAHEVITKYRC